MAALGRNSALSDWLRYIEALHPRTMELGLERVGKVADRLQPSRRIADQQIIVAGTNGKGSTVAYLDAIGRAAGWRTATYTSPHLHDVRERVTIAGELLPEPIWTQALARVERARADIPLTYFEFLTLAAFLMIADAQVDLAICEVGLGGRLDAVNLLAGDASIVTNIGLDHQAYLGDDREQIGREKAGVFRPGRPAIVADPVPPASLFAVAKAVAAHWLPAIPATVAGSGWLWRDMRLPTSPLAGDFQRLNLGAALTALDALALLPNADVVSAGLRAVRHPARLERLSTAPEIYVDTAHNPPAAEALAEFIASRRRRCHLVLAMLADKDTAAVSAALNPVVDCFFLAPTAGDRGLGVEQLHQRGVFGDAGVSLHDSVATAIDAAIAALDDSEMLVIAGSFAAATAARSHIIAR